jgi:hypothetical protein
VIFIGNQDVVVFKDPIKNDAHTFRWWAQRGRVHWEDQTTGEYDSITVREALQRMQGLQDMLKGSRASGAMFPEMITAYQGYIDAMINICQKAREQGMPDDANHSRQLGQEIKARRHSRLIVTPGLVPSF